MKVYHGSYTGTGSDNLAVTSPGFKPDLVWIRRVGSTDTGTVQMYFTTSSMPTGYSTTWREDAAFVTNAIKSLDTNGFTLGTNAAVNYNGDSYYYVAVKDNGAGDFAVGSFYGNAQDSQSIKCGFQPDFLLIKSNSAIVGSATTSEILSTNKGLQLWGGPNRSDLFNSLDSDGFTISNGSADAANLINVDGTLHVWFAFKKVTGKVGVQSYVGDGTDNRNISLTDSTITPVFCFLKGDASVAAMVRFKQNTGDQSHELVNSVYWTNAIQSFSSGTVQVGSETRSNQNTINFTMFVLADDFETTPPLINKISSVDSGFANTVNGGDTNPFTSGQKIGYTVQSGDALPPDVYYWRVRTKNIYGEWGSWSSTRSFTVTGITVDFLQNTGDTADNSTYTFASQNLGTANDERYIVVAAMARKSGAGLNLSSVTIGGVSATIVKQQTNSTTNSNCVGIAMAKVPTGTSGNIVVTWDNSVNRCAIGVWRVLGVSGVTAYDTDGSTADDPSVNIDCEARGVIFGASITATTGTTTWTGIDENFDATLEGFIAYSGGYKTFGSAQSGLLVKSDFSSSAQSAGAFIALSANFFTSASRSSLLTGKLDANSSRSAVLTGETGGITIQLEQSKAVTGTGYVNSLNIALDDSVLDGSLLVLGIAREIATSGVVVSVEDNNGNTWNKIDASSAEGYTGGELWYVQNANAGSTTVTVTITASQFHDLVLICREYSGIATTGALDVHTWDEDADFVQSHSSGATSSTSTDDQLVVGFSSGTEKPGGYSAGSGYGNLIEQGGFDDFRSAAMEDKIISSTGTQTATFTSTAYMQCINMVATFKKDTAGTDVNDYRSANLHGQSTANALRSSLIHGAVLTNNSRDSLLHGQVNTNNSRAGNLVGQNTDNNTRASNLTGQAVSNDNRDSNLHGEALVNNSRTAKTTGYLYTNNSRDSRLVGQAFADSDRDSVITGELSSNSSRDSVLTGTDESNDSKEALLFGQDLISNNREVLVHGELDSNSGRDSVLFGSLGVGDSRESVISGVDSYSDSRGANLHGSNLLSSEIAVQLNGQLLDTNSRTANIHGESVLTDTRDIRLVGQNIGIDDRGSRLVGQEFESDFRAGELWGQLFTNNSRVSRIAGEDFANSSVDVVTIGQVLSNDSRGAKLRGYMRVGKLMSIF